MPPQVALLLCAAFVLCLLRLDRRESPGVSSAAWLPTLWLFWVSSKPLAAWFPSLGGDEFASPADQCFGLALMVLGLWFLVRRQFNWSAFIRAQPWLFLVLGYMLVSVVWADLPWVSFKRGIRLVLAFVMVGVVLSEQDPRLAAESVLRRLAYLTIPLSIVLIKYYPHLGVEFHRWTGERMWVGVSQQKNGLARVCIVGLLCLLWRFAKRWRTGRWFPSDQGTAAEAIVLLGCLWLLFSPEGKTSATSIAAFLLGGISSCGFAWFGRGRVLLAKYCMKSLVVILVLFGIGLPVSGAGLNPSVARVLGRDSTLTGRADTWRELVDVAMRHPLFGCGFDSYWTPETRELHRMSHGHNAYLEIFNELGVCGLALFSIYLLSLAGATAQTSLTDPNWARLCVAYLFTALTHGVAESSINSFSSIIGGRCCLLAAHAWRPIGLPAEAVNRVVPGRKLPKIKTIKTPC